MAHAGDGDCSLRKRDNRWDRLPLSSRFAAPPATRAGCRTLRLNYFFVARNALTCCAAVLRAWAGLTWPRYAWSIWL